MQAQLDRLARLSPGRDILGLERIQAYEDQSGQIIHAEMSHGSGVIMIGTGEPPQPDSAEGVSPRAHGTYVVVDDVDAHHARARAAGATIVYPPEDTEFGTRRYRALDLEGYEWSFGTYEPSP